MSINIGGFLSDLEFANSSVNCFTNKDFDFRQNLTGNIELEGKIKKFTIFDNLGDAKRLSDTDISLNIDFGSERGCFGEGEHADEFIGKIVLHDSGPSKGFSVKVRLSLKFEMYSILLGMKNTLIEFESVHETVRLDSKKDDCVVGYISCVYFRPRKKRNRTKCFGLSFGW